MKQTNESKTPTRFSDLIAAYNATPMVEKTLVPLSEATAAAVLKKVIDPQRHSATKETPAATVSNSGHSPVLVSIRSEMYRDRRDLDRLAYATENASRLAFNADGELTREIIDPDLEKAAADLIGQTLGDGLDLVHEAAVAILDETAKQLDRDPDMPTDLERPYTVRRLKRKVWIKTAESVKAWETVETTPIQEVYKAIRRAIQNSRAMQTDPRNGYTYLADLATDPESGDQTAIYRRLPKYADLGGRVCDFNGAETVPTTADPESVDQTDRLIAAMKLTDREMTVLKYRLSGYGYKAIATAMGVSVDNAKRCGQRIREKAAASGLTVK